MKSVRVLFLEALLLAALLTTACAPQESKTAPAERARIRRH